jgi:hypothetical protein
MDYASLVLAEPSLAVPQTLAPILVAGSSAKARDRGAALVEAAGVRLAGVVPIADAVERIDLQVRASAIWVELDDDGGDPLDRLLDRIDRDAANGLYAAIVCAAPGLLDPVAARLSRASAIWVELDDDGGDPLDRLRDRIDRDAAPGLLDPVAARLSRGAVELLIAENDCGDEPARVAALALALAAPARGTRLSDVATDTSAARLRQLTDEVGRIAATLARLSSGPSTPAPIALPTPRPTAPDPAPDIAPETIRAVIRARRLRARFFANELFADPAWDMLLDLTQAEISQVRVPVSSLCIAAAVPATTALRWIKTLTDSGLLLRRADPHDGRRVFVEMAPNTSLAMRNYFGEVGRVAGA